jgi:hypothetical protein
VATEAPAADHPTAIRAVQWAREWYPGGKFAVTGVTGAEAVVLVEVEGNIHILRYENLDAGCRCN